MVEREKVSERYVQFFSAGLKLEGVLHLPQGEGQFPGVVVCHPHPLYGGSMSNNITMSVCQALATASIIALRFNFRGVGRSEGNFANGVGEQEDVKAAITFLSSVEKVNPARVGLVGYSFSTAVALPVLLQDKRLQAVALISPFLPPLGWEQLKGYLKPKLILCGNSDQFIPCWEVEKFAAMLPQPKQCEVIPGADHFWWGSEEEINRRITTFFSTALKK